MQATIRESVREKGMKEHKGARGAVVSRRGREWFEVDSLEGLSSFMMMVTSDRDHWIFINSDGSLTCGRRNPDHALLPYYTVDKLQDMRGRSGSYSGIRLKGERGFWQPYGELTMNCGPVQRVLRKTDLGDWVELEETHLGWGLRWTIGYRSSGRLGIVRQVTVENVGEERRAIEVLDGLRNLLCPGVEVRFQNEFSCLGDAYKQGEYLASGRMGIYALSSLPTDMAQPMEALRAHVVWAAGWEGAQVTLSADAGEAFARGERLQAEHDIRGRRLAYLMHGELSLDPGQTRSWYQIADVDYDRDRVERRQREIAAGEWSSGEVERACGTNAQRLRDRLYQADGMQCTRDARGNLRHMSNTLFNLMRGGALPTGYQFPEEDLALTIKQWNRTAAQRLAEYRQSHPGIDVFTAWQDNAMDADLQRLTREYLPMTFSRRHGDPSRPWNRFSIELEDGNGNARYTYQGNWRDIFQNWEALLQSYPCYYPSAINRFLNSSSADGYNPYRVTKDGFAWEEPSAEDPWANIGYWGDHQIIYLLRLLESAERYLPGWWRNQLTARSYVYADIPYRICEYGKMLANPRETIDYDDEHAAVIRRRVAELGSDGKLLHHGADLVRVSLLEKLCVPMLAKLANFAPDAGIWMNTQRPEWNDANNALVGYGVSVVTAGYLYRYAAFLERLLAADLEGQEFAMSKAVAHWLMGQAAWFAKEPFKGDDAARAEAMRGLAEMADHYRAELYCGRMGPDTEVVAGDVLLAWLRGAMQHLAETLRANRRDDGLYHSYNLLQLSPDAIGVRHLYLMLEGQVSILSSGLLSAAECLQICHALRASDLYREDQHSYLLYPDRKLPGFMQKNRVTAQQVARCGDWQHLADIGKTDLLRPLPDGGAYSFHPDLRNADDLRQRLKAGGMDPDSPAARHLLALYEETFHHHAFTGRSGTFYAYEGLGSIYWHMVSKLGLSVLEFAIQADEGGDARAALELLAAYRDIKEGLGVDKPVSVHGAIPTDAYSHTPGHAGAQQPGMTGQVKEDILARFLEWGVLVRDGRFSFTSRYLNKDRELLDGVSECEFLHVNGQRETISLQAGSALFSCCQVPVIYRHAGADGDSILVHYFDGAKTRIAGHVLPATISTELIRRNGRIQRLEVAFTALSI